MKKDGWTWCFPCAPKKQQNRFSNFLINVIIQLTQLSIGTWDSNKWNRRKDTMVQPEQSQERVSKTEPKTCLFLCSILFELTFVFWKMWYFICITWLYLQNTVQDMHDPTISLVLNGDMSLTPRLRGPKLEFGTGIVKADPLLSLTCSFWGGILIVQSVATEWRNLIYLIKEEITTLF